MNMSATMAATEPMAAAFVNGRSRFGMPRDLLAGKANHPRLIRDPRHGRIRCAGRGGRAQDLPVASHGTMLRAVGRTGFRARTLRWSGRMTTSRAILVPLVSTLLAAPLT